ncbi:MAG: Mur ligase family protein, partial [bacterium]|nr:Mur ligase family protein [bacterium]
MNFKQTVAALQQKVARRGINYSLDALRDALEKCENPHHNMPPVIHIAGTNGKGSTANFCAQLLEQNGLNVGLFTSPHLVSYTERIQRNHTPVSEAEFCAYFEQANHADTQDHLSEFEMVTLMAALYFADQFERKAIDVCVIEVGLGGRLDTTNLFNTTLSIITHVDMDHADILGDTISKIATDKAGIIRPNTPVFTTSAQHPDALNAIQTEARLKKAPLTIVPQLAQRDLPNGWPR